MVALLPEEQRFFHSVTRRVFDLKCASKESFSEKNYAIPSKLQADQIDAGYMLTHTIITLKCVRFQPLKYTDSKILIENYGKHNGTQFTGIRSHKCQWVCLHGLEWKANALRFSSTSTEGWQLWVRISCEWNRDKGMRHMGSTLFTQCAATRVRIWNAIKICYWKQMHGNDYDLFVSKQLCCAVLCAMALAQSTFAVHKFWLDEKCSFSSIYHGSGDANSTSNNIELDETR